MSLVSILMSVQNGASFLHAAIDSVLNQHFNNFEFIIVNDGSTDATSFILSQYSDERIVILSQENRGLTCSLNRAFSFSKGEFIARMDADDISMPERLQKQIEFMVSNTDIGLLGSRVKDINTNGDILGFRMLPVNPSEVEYQLRRQRNPFIHGSMMIRRAAFERVGGYDESFDYAQDYELALRIADFYRVTNLEDFLYYLRIRENSTTINKYWQQTCYAKLARVLSEKRRLGLDFDFQKEKNQIFNQKDTVRMSYRKLESLLFCEYGVNYLNTNCTNLARSRFFRSAKLNPRNLRAIVLFLLTYFPAHGKVRRIYQKLKYRDVVASEL